MYNYSIEQVPQLGDVQRIIAKYVIRNAIEKLLLINLGRKKYLLDNIDQMRKNQYLVGTEIDIESNIDRVKTILIEICREVEYDGTFDKLKSFIMENESQDSLEQGFLREYAMNKSTVEYYENKLPVEQEAIKAAEEQMGVNDWTLQQTNLNKIKENQITLRYNNNWESAKLDQLKYEVENEERQSYMHYDRYKILLAREEEAAKNLIDCYQSKINFLEDNLEYWTGEYERQMENIATDIHLTQDWISELEKKISGQEKTYNDYKKNIETFARKRKRLRSARIIQNWWRQIMEKKRLEKRIPSASKPKSPRRKKKNQLASPKNLDNPVEATESTLPVKQIKKKSKRNQGKSKKHKKSSSKF